MQLSWISVAMGKQVHSDVMPDELKGNRLTFTNGSFCDLQTEAVSDSRIQFKKPGEDGYVDLDSKEGKARPNVAYVSATDQKAFLSDDGRTSVTVKGTVGTVIKIDTVQGDISF